MAAERIFFVIKSSSWEQLDKAVAERCWALPLRKNPPQPFDAFNSAFAKGLEVVLIASINKSKKFQGYGVMRSAVAFGNSDLSIENDDGEIVKLSDRFLVEWKKMYPELKSFPGLSFARTQHLKSSIDDTPVNLARNCQEISKAEGEELCRLIDEDMKAFTERKVLAELRRKEAEEEKKSEKMVMHCFDDWAELEKKWALLDNSRPMNTLPDMESVSSDLSERERTVIKDFVDRLQTVAYVVHVSLYGSRRYNTFVEGSDLDLFAIVLFPAKSMAALFPPESTLKNPLGSHYDFTVHTLEYFFELLQRGDSKMLETLYQSPKSIAFTSPVWEKFRDEAIRGRKFLTKASIGNYISEALGNKGEKQIRKLGAALLADSNKKDAAAVAEDLARLNKKWYILQRILVHADRVVRTGNLDLWLEDGSTERQFLLEIRAGKHSHQSLLGRFEAAIQRLQNELEQSPLFEQNAEHYSSFLVATRFPPESELPSTVQSLLPSIGWVPETVGGAKFLLFLSRRRNSLTGSFEYVGIFLSEIREFLAYKSSLTNAISNGCTNFFEINRYCELILKVNFHLLLDTAFASEPPCELLFAHPAIAGLFARKEAFITARLMAKLILWMKNQLPNLVDEGIALGSKGGRREQFDYVRFESVRLLLVKCLGRLSDSGEVDPLLLRQVVELTGKMKGLDGRAKVLAALIEELVGLSLEKLTSFFFEGKQFPDETNLKLIFSNFVERMREGSFHYHDK